MRVLVLAVVVAGCGGIGPGSDTVDRGSAEEKAALRAFIDSPLFALQPPSTGRLLEVYEETKCREISHEPGASRTYELLSDGLDVAAYYEDEAAALGWNLVVQREVDAEAEFSGSKPSLVFERSEATMTLTFFVRFSRDLFSGHPSVSVGGGVADASFCN